MQFISYKNRLRLKHQIKISSKETNIGDKCEFDEKISKNQEKRD
jgi:hypothetical protein